MALSNFGFFNRSSLTSVEKEEYGNSPFFGINLGIDEWGGQVSVNDDVYVILNKKSSFWSFSMMTSLLLFPIPVIAMTVIGKKLFKF